MVGFGLLHYFGLTQKVEDVVVKELKAELAEGVCPPPVTCPEQTSCPKCPEQTALRAITEPATGVTSQPAAVKVEYQIKKAPPPGDGKAILCCGRPCDEVKRQNEHVCCHDKEDEPFWKVKPEPEPEPEP